jgi:uncharacterized protein (DUF2344 family)
MRGNKSPAKVLSSAGVDEWAVNTQLILSAIEHSMKVITDKLDKQEEIIKNLSLENNLLKTEVNKLKEDQYLVNTEMDLLKSDINELHQERLNCEAVISNLPINQSISTDEIVKNILQYVNMSTDQVAGYYNVMKNKFDGQGKIHNIFIKFKSPELQNKFLLAKKRSGPLTEKKM